MLKLASNSFATSGRSKALATPAWKVGLMFLYDLDGDRGKIETKSPAASLEDIQVMQGPRRAAAYFQDVRVCFLSHVPVKLASVGSREQETNAPEGIVKHTSLLACVAQKESHRLF